jgi:hypothetical protein
LFYFIFVQAKYRDARDHGNWRSGPRRDSHDDMMCWQFNVIPRTWLASECWTSHQHNQAERDRNRCPNRLDGL